MSERGPTLFGKIDLLADNIVISNKMLNAVDDINYIQIDSIFNNYCCLFYFYMCFSSVTNRVCAIFIILSCNFFLFLVQ